MLGVNSGGVIQFCYATGVVVNTHNDGRLAGTGGLVGYNGGDILDSYATGNVSGRGKVGGLIGRNQRTVISTYSIGRVSFQRAENSPDAAIAGGLIGDGEGGTVDASYWDSQTSGLSTSGGGASETTSELQSPTGATGIYATWNSTWWDFGTFSQYPALRAGGLDPEQQRR